MKIFVSNNIKKRTIVGKREDGNEGWLSMETDKIRLRKFISERRLN